MHSPTPWTEGALYGALKVEVIAAGRCIATVFVKKFDEAGWPVPWPEGEENLALVLAAPRLRAALQEILDEATGDRDWDIVESAARTALEQNRGRLNHVSNL